LDREAALRKIGLLRRVIGERGATLGEVENATRLAQRLADALALHPDDVVRVKREPRLNTHRSWVYWEQAAREFGLPLHHFGSRGNLRVGDCLVVIDFDRQLWTVKQGSRAGYREIMRKTGLDSFRQFLQLKVPRRRSMANG
jgi:hypothetical protein